MNKWTAHSTRFNNFSFVWHYYSVHFISRSMLWHMTKDVLTNCHGNKRAPLLLYRTTQTYYYRRTFLYRHRFLDIVDLSNNQWMVHLYKVTRFFHVALFIYTRRLCHCDLTAIGACTIYKSLFTKPVVAKKRKTHMHIPVNAVKSNKIQRASIHATLLEQ